jgi:CRP-like cAMP-binding protein
MEFGSSDFAQGETQMVEEQIAIEDLPLFRHLDETHKARLVEATSAGSFAAGERLIEQGARVSHLFWLVSGRVRVWTRAGDREVDLATLEEGSFFGEVSVVGDKLATATVEAIEPGAQVLAVERETLRALAAVDDQLRRALEGSTLARARDTLSKVLE